MGSQIENQSSAPPKQPAPIDVRGERPSIPLGTPLVPGPLVNGPLMHVSPTLSPEVIKSFPDYGDDTAPYVQPAVDALAAVSGAIQAVVDARIAVNKNVSWSEERRLVKIADFAFSKNQAAAAAVDSAAKRLTQGIAALETQLAQPMQATADTTISAEVRAHAKNLSDDARRELITNAMEQRDTRSLSAILAAPPYLSGLDRARQIAYTEQFNALMNPDASKRLRVLRSALAHIDLAGSLIMPSIISSLGFGKDVWQKAERARKLVRDAEDALRIA